jgi:hypothetical protein
MPSRRIPMLLLFCVIVKGTDPGSWCIVIR